MLEAYEVKGTPSAVLVNPDGAIASALVEGPEAISAGVAFLAEGGVPCSECGGFHDTPHAIPITSLEIGEPAPEIELPDLSGESVRLSDYRGGETIVLFWSPNCGFCERMLDDLKEWEANPPKGAPELLVISAQPRC